MLQSVPLSPMLPPRPPLPMDLPLLLPPPWPIFGLLMANMMFQTSGNAEIRQSRRTAVADQTELLEPSIQNEVKNNFIIKKIFKFPRDAQQQHQIWNARKGIQGRGTALTRRKMKS